MLAKVIAQALEELLNHCKDSLGCAHLDGQALWKHCCSHPWRWKLLVHAGSGVLTWLLSWLCYRHQICRVL